MMEGIVNKSAFNPEQLRNAREARGLTIRELGDLIGLTHQSISKYENGKSIPSAEVILKIMKFLSVPYAYFFENPYTENEEKIVYFRSKANSTLKMKKVHQVKISWLISLYEKMESIIDFPKMNIFEFGNSKQRTYFQPTDFDTIEKLAIKLRKYWGLNSGPISDLTHLFEKNGIVISLIQSESYSIDACSKWRESDARLFILVGNDNSTPSRIKFSLAHELGHYLLHKNVNKNDFNKKEVYKRMEEEANRFASAFLLPENAFSNELMNNSLEYYLLLKKRWKVSIQAMIYRSKDLNLINADQASYLWRQINQRGWRFNEPYDNYLESESTMLLKSSIELVIDHNVKTKSDLLDELALGQLDIEMLANLSIGYFNPNINKENVIRFKIQ